MNREVSSLFESFNARFLDAGKVGSNFVLSPHLNMAASNSHTAILGPRGSGKTTLLKMLTVPALLRWNDPARYELAAAMEFLAVYIPASLTWSADYRTFSSKKLAENVDDLLSVSLFRHSTIVSMIETCRNSSDPGLGADDALEKFSIKLTPVKEAELTRQLGRTWELEPAVSTLLGLREAATNRIRLLQRLSLTAAIEGLSARELLAMHPFLAANFFDDASGLVDALEPFLGSTLKIALCFDEIEIAAKAVANVILRAPRSLDQRLLIKFSAAPYVASSSDLTDPSVPTQGNDFQFVFLSSYASSQMREFSEELFLAIGARHKVPVSPVQILGRSFHEAEDRGAKSSYAEEGSRTKKFAALYDRDQSFRRYMNSKRGFDAKLSAGSESQRAAEVRKILWPVLVREEFLFDPHGSGNTARRLRSKEPVSDLYTGAGAMIALCEGNPRWIIGLMEPLIREYASIEADLPRMRIKRSSQKAALEKMIAAYFALLSTIPGQDSKNSVQSLVDLIDKIGGYFRTSILGVEFNPDPVLSFVVDDKVDDHIRELVGRGVNIGAFVATSDALDRPYRVGSVNGLRMRLSYILAPRYKLPLVAGRTVNLSSILRRTSNDTGALVDLFGTKI